MPSRFIAVLPAGPAVAPCAMAVTTVGPHDEFQAAFCKEVDVYFAHLSKPGRGEKKDPERIQSLKTMAEAMGEHIAKRAKKYAQDLQLNPVDMEPRMADHLGNASLRAQLEELEAELRERTAEEDALRNEVLMMHEADSEEALRRYDTDLLRARQAAFTDDIQLDGEEVVMKGQCMVGQLQQMENVVSATEHIAATIERDRENNRRIEEQRRRPLHYMEAEMMAPIVDAVVAASSSSGFEEDEESLLLSAEVARSQKVCRRMREQFDDPL